jgi:hypothetical protein
MTDTPTTPPPGEPAGVSAQKAAERPRPWERAFLSTLRATGNHSAACRAAHIDRSTPYEARDEDPGFAAAYQDALAEACDALEAEARRRAHDGVPEPVVYQGELCGQWLDAEGRVVTRGTPGARLVPLTITRYSDSLLMFLLRGHRPERFRDRASIEHTGSGPGGAIQHEVSADHEHHIDADPDRLAAILRALAEAAAPGPGPAGAAGDAPADQVRPAPAPPQAGGLPAAGLP